MKIMNWAKNSVSLLKEFSGFEASKSRGGLIQHPLEIISVNAAVSDDSQRFKGGKKVEKL